MDFNYIYAHNTMMNGEPVHTGFIHTNHMVSEKTGHLQKSLYLFEPDQLPYWLRGLNQVVVKWSWLTGFMRFWLSSHW